jgi:hypothetical protein
MLVVSQVAYNIQLEASGIVCLSAPQLPWDLGAYVPKEIGANALETGHQYATNRLLQAE